MRRPLYPFSRFWWAYTRRIAHQGLDSRLKSILLREKRLRLSCVISPRGQRQSVHGITQPRARLFNHPCTCSKECIVRGSGKIFRVGVKYRFSWKIDLPFWEPWGKLFLRSPFCRSLARHSLTSHPSWTIINSLASVSSCLEFIWGGGGGGSFAQLQARFQSPPQNQFAFSTLAFERIVLSSAYFSLRGCVNPASWLLLDARASFAQPLNEKYPLQSRLSNLRTSLGNYTYKSFSLLAQTSFWGKKILSLVAKKFWL